MADKNKVKINTLTRLTALIILELFLFSDFAMPLSQINPAYALVPSLRTNGTLAKGTGRGGAITVEGRELTAEQHIAVNQAVLQDFASGEARELTEEDLRDLDPDGIAERNRVTIYEMPRLREFDDVLVAHPGRGGETYSHSLKQVYLSPKRVKFIRSLSREAKKQFWEHEILGHLVKFVRGASEEGIQARYPINLVRDAAQIAALQQQSAPQRAQLKQLLIYIAQKNLIDFIKLYKLHKAKQLDKDGYEILLKYTNEALGQNWVPGPNIRDREEVFEEVNQLLTSGQITASAKPDIGWLPTAKLYTEGIEGEFEQLVKRVPVQISGDITYEELMNAGFQPHYKIVVNGVAYYVSEPYTPSHGRASFVYYFYRKNPKTGEEEIFTRSVYRSNSQNVLRVASHRRPERRWIGKGLGQATTTLPLELQSTFEKIYQTALSKGKLEKKEAFYEILRAKDSHMPADSFMKSMIAYERGEEAEQKDEKEPEEQILIGKFNEHDRDQIEFIKGEMIFPRGIPETFGFTPGFEPDFENGVVETFETDNPVYGGKVTSYRIISKNKEAQYLFNVDMKGRVWIGDVQGTHSEITRFGVRKNTIYIPSDFLTPANEYESEIPEGYKGEWQHSDYWDASAYIDKLPVVQEFRDKVLNKLSPAPILTKIAEAASVEDETANIIQQEITFFDGRTREFKLLLIALLYSKGSRETVRELILSQGNVVDNQYIIGLIFTKTNIKNKEELISAVNQYATNEPNIERHIEDAVNIAKTYNKDYSDTAQNVLFKLATYRAHTELKKPKAVEKDRHISQFLKRILSRVRNNENVTISFVCTANKNRSAVSHIMLKNKLQQLGKSNVRVQSAGIATRLVGLEGEPLSLELEQLLRGRGVDAGIINDFRSQQVTADFVRNSDIIVVASDEHRQALINAIPEAASKIVLFTELHTDLGKFGNAFPDPEAREISRVALVNLIENTIVAGFIEQVEGHTPAAVLKEPVKIVKKTKTLSVEKGETELEALFVGDVWITAGLFTYRIWVENYTVNFQRYDSKEGWPLGNVRNFALGYEFRIGGERGYKNDYRLHGDPKLAPSHFLVKLTRGEKDNTYKLSVKDLNSLNGTTVEWNESLTPREAAPEEEMPISPTETPHQRFVRMYNEATQDAVKQGRLQKLILAVALWWDADTNARDNGIEEDNKAKALEVLDKRGNQHLSELRSSLEAVVSSRYPYSIFWEQADRPLFMKILELAFGAPEQQNRSKDYIPLIDELFPPVLEAKAGRGAEPAAPPQALPQAVSRVYTDLDSLERDISALEVGLQSIDIVKLPRIGFHGEKAGHKPVGEFWYFLLDANLKDYWRQEWRDDNIEAMFKLGAAKKAGNKTEVLAEMFMPLSEFFERLQGTIIFTSSYGKLSSSEGVLPEIYLLMEVPESNFQLRDKSAEKEGSKVSAYDPKVGMKEYRLLFVEGNTDSQSVPKEAVVTKIGLTKEEFTAIAQWASRDGSGTLGMSFFVNRLLYKKTLENLISLGRIQPASASKSLNNQQTRFIRAMVMLLRALGAVDGDVNRVTVNLTRLAERALSGETDIAPILQEDAGIFLDAWREYEEAGGDVNKITQTRFNKVLELLGNSATEIAESFETSGAIAVLENLARQSGASAAFHLTEQPANSISPLTEHAGKAYEVIADGKSFATAKAIKEDYCDKDENHRDVTVHGVTVRVANNITETGFTADEIQQMLEEEFTPGEMTQLSPEDNPLRIVAADKLPGAALGGDCVGNKLVLLSKGLKKIKDRNAIAGRIMTRATLRHEIRRHELTGIGKEAHTPENDADDVEYVIEVAKEEGFANLKEFIKAIEPTLYNTELFNRLFIQAISATEAVAEEQATEAESPVKLTVPIKEGPSLVFGEKGREAKDSILNAIRRGRINTIEIGFDSRAEGKDGLNRFGLALLDPSDENISAILKEIKDAAEENEVSIRVHLPWCAITDGAGVNRDLSMETDLAYFVKALELTKEVGAETALFHINWILSDDELKFIVALVKKAHKDGITLISENGFAAIPGREYESLFDVFQSSLYINPAVYVEQVGRIVEAIKKAGREEENNEDEYLKHFAIGFDTAHTALAYMQRETPEIEKDIETAQKAGHVYLFPGMLDADEIRKSVINAAEEIVKFARDKGIAVGEVHLAQPTIPEDGKPIVIGDEHKPLLARGGVFTREDFVKMANILRGETTVFIQEVSNGGFQPLTKQSEAEDMYNNVARNKAIGENLEGVSQSMQGVNELTIALSPDTLRSAADLMNTIETLKETVKKIRLVVYVTSGLGASDFEKYKDYLKRLFANQLGFPIDVEISMEKGDINSVGGITTIASLQREGSQIIITDGLALEQAGQLKESLADKVGENIFVVIRQQGSENPFFLSWLFKDGKPQPVSIFTDKDANDITTTISDFMQVFEAYRKQI